MNLSSRQRAFFLIVLKQHSNRAQPFLRSLSDGSGNEMLALFNKIKDHSPKEIESVANNELRVLAKPATHHYLADVHNDWIVTLLEKEPPEIIGAVLRYLPAERVHAVLSVLPAEIIAAMPKMAETYAVPESLVELFQRKIESFFPLKRTFEPGQKFAYEHFCLLRAEQVLRVYYELGYREVALGLVSIPERTRRVVLDRLSPADRRAVELNFAEAGQAVPMRLKRAQMHLVSHDVDTRKPQYFIKDLGFLLFAKTVLPVDLDDLEIVKKKLSRRDAETLSRFVSLQLEKNTEATVVGYREDLLVAVRSVLSPRTRDES